MVKKYKATIVAIENKIEGVYTLSFSSEKGFKYSPGQFLHIAIDPDYDGSGQWPESRCFSLQSSPTEEYAKITYAVKGDFTRQMEKTLKVGSEVWLKLPYGELFEQEHNKAKTVFIAGGTGITPFLSLFTDESFRAYENPNIYLGFRSKEYNIYDEALNSMFQIRENSSNSCNSSPFVQLVYIEMLDIDAIFAKNGTDASYFISGPPVMIKLFKQSLIEKGVPDGNVLTDDWE
jgi:ferredoxin-NADP reductase